MSLYLFISASFMIHFCLLAQNKYGQCPLDTYIVPFPTFPSSWWFWNPWKVWQTCISERFTNMATTDRRAGKTNHSDCTSSTIVADYKQRSAQTPHWQGRYIQVLLNRKGIWSTWTSRPTNRSCPCKPTLSHGAPAVGTSSCPSPPAASLIRLKKKNWGSIDCFHLILGEARDSFFEKFSTWWERAPAKGLSFIKCFKGLLQESDNDNVKKCFKRPIGQKLC